MSPDEVFLVFLIIYIYIYIYIIIYTYIHIASLSDTVYGITVYDVISEDSKVQS